MGLDWHALKFLQLHTKVTGFGTTLTFGRQQLHLTQKELRKFRISSSYSYNEYIERFLADELQIYSVQSIDANDYEGCTIIHDLNTPIPMYLKANFETIIDLGSLEHIFDLKTAFKNISNLLSVGGWILHVVPSNQFAGHGLYQFSPELFHSLYSETNGFAQTEIFLASPRAKGKWWSVNFKSDGFRRTFHSTVPTYLLVRSMKIRDVYDLSVQQSDYEFIWNNSTKFSQGVEKSFDQKSGITLSRLKRIADLTLKAINLYILTKLFKVYKTRSFKIRAGNFITQFKVTNLKR